MKNITVVFFLVLVTTLNAQNFKFGKVSKEELLEKKCLIDTSANAAILYNYRNTYFTTTNAGLRLYTEVHKRIKIYSKEGFDSATEEIALFKANSANEFLSKIKAYTYNISNGEIQKAELKKEQIFKSELNYNYNLVKFTMPNVKVGSVIEFKYRIESPFIWSIDDFVFQYSIPVKKEILRLKTIEGIDFNTTYKGYINTFPKKSSDFDSSLGLKMIINTYELQNVPALKEEKYVDNINNYRAGVMFELVSITIPGTFSKYYAQSWADVAKTIGSSDDYRNGLDKTRSFNDTLTNLVSEVPNQLDKMKLIFKYVKDNITWNGMDGKYFYNGIRKSLKEKKGNAADINLTLVAMLRFAGIKSNPVVISTKDNVIPYYPTVDRLNTVIAYAKINDKQYFLDATEEFSDINVLPVKDYNWKGILIDNPNKIWKKIDLREPELSISQYSINAKLSEDGVIKGNFRSKYTKHKAFEYRKHFKDKDLETFITNREALYKNIEISNYEVKNAKKYEGTVEESFSYYQEEGADVINDKIYIQPFSLLKLAENPFKIEERLFPIDFGYSFFERSIISIETPEGYVAESEPIPIVIKIPNNLGEFKYYPTFVGNKLNLRVDFRINKSVITSDNYLFLKEFFNQMIIKENEQIVLTKA